MVEEPREQPQQPAAPQPSPLEIGGRVARLLLGRAIWASEQGWRLSAPRLGWLLLTGFLVSVIGVLSLMLVLPRLVRSGVSAGPQVAAIPPAAAVEDFLRGQQTYDADLMWASLSPELRQALEGREITHDSLAQQAESERRAGQRYGGFNYIGGVALAGSQRMYFYTVAIASSQKNETVPFVFTVGRDGKIVNIR
jgi:hypothetical protein